MTKNSKKIKPGWEIPEEIKESFRDFCIQVGSVAQEDCAGALFLWKYMPAKLREWAKLESKNWRDEKGRAVVDPDFWKGLSAGLEVSLRSLTESQPKKKPKKRRNQDKSD